MIHWYSFDQPYIMHNPAALPGLFWFLCCIVLALNFAWRSYLHSDFLAESDLLDIFVDFISIVTDYMLWRDQTLQADTSDLVVTLPFGVTGTDVNFESVWVLFYFFIVSDIVLGN